MLLRLFLLIILIVPQPARATDKPLVLVSIPPQAYFLERIAGGHVKVEVLLPKGASAETFEPNLQQLTRAQNAELYLMLGHPHFHFEKIWQQYLSMHVSSIKTVRVLNNSSFDEHDLHVWLAPSSAKGMLAAFEAALEEILPDRRELFRDNLNRLLADIDALRDRLHAKLAPFAGKTFLVFHPAFGYFAKEFNLNQLAIERDGKEPDPAHIASVIKQAKKLSLKIILVTPQFPKTSAELIAREIGARVVFIDDLAYEWPEMLVQLAAELERSFGS